MNNSIALFLSAALMTAGTSVALARDAGGEHAGMASMNMDANGDGLVSRDEYLKYQEAMFDRMKNQDGVVAKKTP